MSIFLRFKTYYYLTKPNIIYVNLITATGGFFLASSRGFHFWLLIECLAGLGAIIASGCVFNNYIDRDIDAKMARTKNRPLVTHIISHQAAIVYAIILGLIGIAVLLKYTIFLTVIVAFAGAFIYLAVYTPLKRRTVYGALLGSLSGAVPPLVGYSAAAGKLDIGALIIFLILVIWQMPHFYAIAIRRFDDYKDAVIPVFPVKKGIPRTKLHILLYIIAFLIVSPLLTLFQYTGWIYFSTALILSVVWLVLAIKGFKKGTNDITWSRTMFLFSLIVLTGIFIAIPLDRIKI